MVTYMKGCPLLDKCNEAVTKLYYEDICSSDDGYLVCPFFHKYIQERMKVEYKAPREWRNSEQASR